MRPGFLIFPAKNGSGSSAAPTSDSIQTTAFVSVNVIPMDRERVLTNQTVVVRNGVIVEIGDTKKIKIPKNAFRVDGTGKFLIPGLVDMHTHLLSDGDEYPDSIAEDELKVMGREWRDDHQVYDRHTGTIAVAYAFGKGRDHRTDYF